MYYGWYYCLAYTLLFTYLKQVIISQSFSSPQEWKEAKCRTSTNLFFISSPLFARRLSCVFNPYSSNVSKMETLGPWLVTLRLMGWAKRRVFSGSQLYPCLLYPKTCCCFPCSSGDMVSRPLTISSSFFTGRTWSTFKKKIVAITHSGMIWVSTVYQAL